MATFITINETTEAQRFASFIAIEGEDIENGNGTITTRSRGKIDGVEITRDVVVRTPIQDIARANPELFARLDSALRELCDLQWSLESEA